MARLLLDENMPRSAGAVLSTQGHDVVLVADIEPGAGDPRVLALARQEDRILVTFDSDFGDLVFQQGAAAPPAIVCLRLHPITGAGAAALVTDALRGDPRGCFVVATRDGVRRRPLPQTAAGGSGC